jgi:hypothetical protein
MTYPKTKKIREERRKLAEDRNALYAALSLEEKLARQNPNGKVAAKLAAAQFAAQEAEAAQTEKKSKGKKTK